MHRCLWKVEVIQILSTTWKSIQPCHFFPSEAAPRGCLYPGLESGATLRWHTRSRVLAISPSFVSPGTLEIKLHLKKLLQVLPVPTSGRTKMWLRQLSCTKRSGKTSWFDSHQTLPKMIGYGHVHFPFVWGWLHWCTHSTQRQFRVSNLTREDTHADNMQTPPRKPCSRNKTHNLLGSDTALHPLHHLLFLTDTYKILGWLWIALLAVISRVTDNDI